jgi:hypothetical protein
MTEEEAVQKALKTLNRHMSEGRRTPRRHQLFAFYVLFGVMLLALAIAGILTILNPGK